MWWASQRGWTVAKVERSIHTEVAPDCDRRTVEAWFDRHGIRHYWFENASEGVQVLRTRTQSVGFRNEDVSGMLRGDIEGPEVNVDLVFPGRIFIYFFFDKQGRRIGHVVDPFVYNL